jgi:hypothetical protein
LDESFFIRKRKVYWEIEGSIPFEVLGCRDDFGLLLKGALTQPFWKHICAFLKTNEEINVIVHIHIRYQPF